MAVNIGKGGRVSLSKDNANVDRLLVAAGWDKVGYVGVEDFDLDIVAFLVGADGKAKEEHFIYWRNTEVPGILHSGDNRDGAGDGDDESLKVSLKNLPEGIVKIVFAIAIFDGDIRNQNFGMISNAYIRIVDEQTGEERVKFDLSEDYDIQRSIVAGEVYLHNGDWKFKAIGEGYETVLKDLCAKHGIETM